MTLEDAYIKIHIDNYGSIVCDSVFEREFEGDIDLLIACIEDNIYEDDNGYEVIDWELVFRDYADALNEDEEIYDDEDDDDYSIDEDGFQNGDTE